jgi:hypothetical protein
MSPISMEPSALAVTPASSPVSRRPTVPARLVMLTQPASGAEFVLPTDRRARLGRSDEVDCPINHRSVSREHAEVRREGEGFHIEDLGSANGVTVNGRPIKTVELRSGDIIELGQVVFRFVAAGEHYFFDPGDASRFRSASSGRQGANLRLAILLGAVTLAALVFIALPTPDAQHEDAEVSGTIAAADGDLAPQAEAPLPGDDGFDKAVLACRSALAAMRFAEAAAHASMALKARPASQEALDCKQRADSQSAEEQAYVRGKDALVRGELELAYQEFSKLPEGSTFRARPEVTQASNDLARARLAESQATLPKSRGDAARLAQSVLGLWGVSNDLIAQAEQAVTDARRGGSSAPAQTAAVTPPPRPSKPVEAPTPVARPAQPPAQAAVTPRPAATPTPARPTAAPASASGAPLMEVVNGCLARGDNECVVHALEGSATTAQELGLLIETYRAIGDVRMAQKNMTTYVQRFPDNRRSETYRRMLELQQQ